MKSEVREVRQIHLHSFVSVNPSGRLGPLRKVINDCPVVQTIDFNFVNRLHCRYTQLQTTVCTSRQRYAHFAKVRFRYPQLFYFNLPCPAAVQLATALQRMQQMRASKNPVLPKTPYTSQQTCTKTVIQ